MARRFADGDVARYRRFEDDFAEKVANFPLDFPRQFEGRVAHRQRDPAVLERSAVATHRLADHFDHLNETLHREIFALDRRQHLRRPSERGAGQRPERRRAVDQDEVVSLRFSGELTRHSLETVRIVRGGQALDVAETTATGENVESRRRSAERFANRSADDERVARRRVETEAARRVALRVEIDQQRSGTGARESGGEGNRRRRFADSAFLISDADNSNHNENDF